MEYAVDVLGFFDDDGEFVHKEIAILCLNNDKKKIPDVYLFDEPFPWCHLSEEKKRSNQYRTSERHGIPWESGFWPYMRVFNTWSYLQEKAAKLYVRDEFQKKWWSRTHLPIINMVDHGYPCITFTRKRKCQNHPALDNAECALEHVKRMRRFYKRKNGKEWTVVPKSESKD